MYLIPGTSVHWRLTTVGGGVESVSHSRYISPLTTVGEGL